MNLPDPPEPDVDESEPAEAPITFRNFLETIRVNVSKEIIDYIEPGTILKSVPQLILYCDKDCQGYRRFDGRWGSVGNIGTDSIARDYLTYKCRDCGNGVKTYAILSCRKDQTAEGVAIKVGEFPEMHVELPASLPSLLGPDYPLFIKGLKSEKLGLGIGAFTYYRRVVENQRGRMFTAMANAARRLQFDEEMIKELEIAATEPKFAKAIDNVKDHVPPQFKIDGHNPMKILHAVLSNTIHAKDDEEALETAQHVRVVLQDLAIRIKAALRDDAEARASLSELMKKNADRAT